MTLKSVLFSIHDQILKSQNRNSLKNYEFKISGNKHICTLCFKYLVQSFTKFSAVVYEELH